MSPPYLSNTVEHILPVNGLTRLTAQTKTLTVEVNLTAEIIAPAGFWPLRRHPRIPRVNTYKDKEDLLKK